MTCRWAATMGEKEMRRPASDPSPRHMTTLKLPAVHNGINPTRWLPPELGGWSARPLGYQSRRRMSILDSSVKDYKHQPWHEARQS